MSDEEKKAHKSEYMKKYYRNMNDYQREKRRLKNLENKKRIAINMDVNIVKNIINFL